MNQEIKIGVFDTLNAKKNSENPVKWFDESCDNSIQYGSKKILIKIDEERKMVSVEDNGRGLCSNDACIAFHQPYFKPIEMGVSKYGIGSKIFKTLSDTRVCFSKGISENSQILYFFSVWNTAERTEAGKPLIFSWTAGETAPEEALMLAEEFNIKNDYENFMSSDKTGLLVFLINIDDNRIKSFFKSWSKLYKKVSVSCFERYHYYLHKNKDLQINLQYINNKGVQHEIKKVDSVDIFSNIDKSQTRRHLKDQHSLTEILSCIKKDTKEVLNKRGIHFYRNNIKIATISFKKYSGLNASETVDLDPTKREYRNNEIGQIILSNDLDDDLFHLGETKDKINLPEQISKICADHYKLLEGKLQQMRSGKVRQKVTKEKWIGEFIEEEDCSFKGAEGVYSLSSDSVLHNLIKKSDEALSISTSLLKSFGEIYLEKESASSKTEFTKLTNRIGQMIERYLEDSKI